MLYIVIAILIFGVLIATHELGHFAAAKMLGVKVNEFSIGMGPAIFKKQGKETNFHIDKNKKTAFKKINRAYSGEHGKVKSILQYASHYFCFKELGEDCTAHLIMQIITCEIKHLLTLTEIAKKACSSPEFLTYSKNTWEYYDTNKKNINDNPNKHSRTIFAETIHEIWQKNKD